MRSHRQRKLRIALVGPWKGTIGGVTTFMTNVVSSPLAQTYDFLRFNTARPPKPNVSDNYGYGSIWKGGVRRLVAGGAITLAHVLTFPIWLLVRRPDLVQVQSSDFQTFWESAFYVGFCKLAGIPVAERLGGAFDNFYSVSSPRARSLIRRLLKWPNRLIVQSSYWRDFVADLGRREGVYIVPNWIADRLAAPRAAQPPQDYCECLFSAGSEAARKGIDDVMAAAAALKAQQAPVRFRIIAASEELHQRVGSLELSDVCELNGYLNHGQMMEAMRRADVFLLPSRAEGFPNALVEAMASSLAAVVTPVGAIPEIVEGNAAVTIPVGDAAALAREIGALAADPVRRAAIGETARLRVLERYSETAALGKLESVWRSLPRTRDARHLTLIGPLAQSGQPAQGGYESANLRLLVVLRDISDDARALPYPRTGGSTFHKTLDYFAGFCRIGAIVAFRPGGNAAIHFTPHCQRFLAAELGLAGLARLRGKRLTVDLRAGFQKYWYDQSSPLYRWGFRRLLSLATTVAYEGEAYAPWLGTVAPAQRKVYLPNFVPAAMLKQRAPAPRPVAPHLAYVGLVSEEKGVNATLRVFQSLQQRLPGITLTLIGRCEEPYRQELLRSGLLGADVVMAGQLAPDAIAAELDRAHFFVYLSHWFGEGHSNALTEAMARGCVPMASDRGFNGEVIGDPALMVADRDDADAVAHRIAEIWTDGRWQTLSDAAVARVAGNFTDRQVRPILSAIYGMSLQSLPAPAVQARTHAETFPD